MLHQDRETGNRPAQGPLPRAILQALARVTAAGSDLASLVDAEGEDLSPLALARALLETDSIAERLEALCDRLRYENDLSILDAADTPVLTSEAAERVTP